MMKRLCALLLAVVLVSAALFRLVPTATAEVGADGSYIDVPASKINVASLTVSDIKGVIGQDVTVYTFEDGTTDISIDFDCGDPLYITLTDGTKLVGEDAYTYLGNYDQYFSFNPLPDERWPEELPSPGTSQKFVCSVCTDLAVTFTVYFVASADDPITGTLEAHTVAPGSSVSNETLPEPQETEPAASEFAPSDTALPDATAVEPAASEAAANDPAAPAPAVIDPAASDRTAPASPASEPAAFDFGTGGLTVLAIVLLALGGACIAASIVLLLKEKKRK